MGEETAKKNWKLGEILGWSVEFLTGKQFENPRLNVEWLLCHALNCKRIDLYADFDRPLTKSEIDRFKTILLRRVDHEPLQYIVGTTDFMGLTFEVTTDVLIPRPDTERVVEIALDVCRSVQTEAVRILDIGTGSGAIAISLVHYLRKYSIPYAMTALDISSKALEVAVRNANAILGENDIRFEQGDLLSGTGIEKLHGSFDMIISNPPYISEEEFAVLPKEVKEHEPALALKAEENGLAFYRKIAEVSKHFFHSKLSKKHVILEVGYDQAQRVKGILVQHGYDVTLYKDYHQVDRVVCGCIH